MLNCLNFKDCLDFKNCFRSKMMNRKEKAKELEGRTKRFAVQIIELAGELPNTEAGKIVKYQMVKAGTSIGADHRKAKMQGASCDFHVIIQHFQEIKLSYDNFSPYGNHGSL